MEAESVELRPAGEITTAAGRGGVARGDAAVTTGAAPAEGMAGCAFCPVASGVCGVRGVAAELGVLTAALLGVDSDGLTKMVGGDAGMDGSSIVVPSSCVRSRTSASVSSASEVAAVLGACDGLNDPRCALFNLSISLSCNAALMASSKERTLPVPSSR